MRIDAALAQKFKAEPRESSLAAELVRGVLSDDADFQRSRIHPMGS
jgi:hypothetical protein